MNDKKRLEKAYRDLMLQETPDLWKQIEERLVSKDEPGTETTVGNRVEQIHAPKKNRTRRRNYRLGTGAAAAACCFFLAAGVMAGRKLLDNEKTGLSGQSNFATATMAACENAAGVTSAGIAADSAGEQLDGAAISRDQDVETVWYENLTVSRAPVLLPPEHAVFTSAEGIYFTEDRLRDVSLLGQMTVNETAFDVESDGQAHHVVYQVTVDTVLYAENYVSRGQELEIVSPLLGDSAEEAALYQLRKGGTYLLPLSYENGSYQLLYPASPQIEVTEDSEYIFHTGWQSLVNDRTRIVYKTPESPKDYYSDRLRLRDDETFLSNLTTLVETKKQEEKHR